MRRPRLTGPAAWGASGISPLPLLHNTLCTCLVLAITGSLKVFDLPWTMFVGGLPVDKSLG